MAVLERLRQAFKERFRPEIKIGTLDGFIEAARLAGTKNVLAEIGDRKVSVQPKEQVVVPAGYDKWEFYTKFSVKGPWERKIVFTQINETAVLSHARGRAASGSGFISLDTYAHMRQLFRKSVVGTDETRHKLLDAGLSVIIQHKGVTYSKEEFAGMIREARLLGSF